MEFDIEDQVLFWPFYFSSNFLAPEILKLSYVQTFGAKLSHNPNNNFRTILTKTLFDYLKTKNCLILQALCWFMTLLMQSLLITLPSG